MVTTDGQAVIWSLAWASAPEAGPFVMSFKIMSSNWVQTVKRSFKQTFRWYDAPRAYATRPSSGLPLT